MNCAEVKPHLVEAVYGELPPVLRPAFQKHLADCPDCRRALAELADAHRMLDTLPDEAATVDMARLYRTALVGNRRSGRRWRPAAVLAASLLLVVAGLAVWRGRIELEADRITISWRDQQQQDAPSVATVGSQLAAHAKHLATLDETIGLLVAELDAQEQNRLESIRLLRERIQDLQQRNTARFDLVQRDFRDLYLASFSPENDEIGDRP